MPPAYCSLRCAKSHGREKRRAVKRNAFVANVNRRDIYERDNWTCQLCHKKVDPTKKVPPPGCRWEPRTGQCPVRSLPL